MKYDGKMKKVVTKDWEGMFPSLRTLKPTRLIRRNGPLLVGICLESGSDPEAYTPIAHFHNLCESFSTISLGLAGRVLNYKGLPVSIKVKNHTELYEEYANKVKWEFPYTVKNNIDFNEFVIATQKYITGRTIPFQHAPYSDIITIAAYLGKKDYAIEALENFSAIISEWPERAFNIIGSVEKWRNGLVELVNNAEQLHKTVEQEIIKHKLEGVVDNGLAWSEKPLKLWEMPCRYNLK